MAQTHVVVSLPTADRRTSYHFYREGLGFDAIGEPANDGVPEPLQFALNDGVRIMLVPTGGFGWVIGDHEVAPRGQSECVLSIGAQTDADVAEVIERAREAGATILTEARSATLGLRRHLRRPRRPHLDGDIRDAAELKTGTS